MGSKFIHQDKNYMFVCAIQNIELFRERLSYQWRKAYATS